jgi:nucleotide-binding universal stress UspA family protein
MKGDQKVDPRTIIWATNGSDQADRALEVVRDFAKGWPDHPRIVAAHIDQRVVARGMNVSVLADEQDLLAKIRSQVQDLEAEGFAADFELCKARGMNDESAMVSSIAKEYDADLIVVGTRGRRRLTGALMGSMAEGLLHNAPCPVLVVPPAHGRQPEEKTEALTGTPAVR